MCVRAVQQRAALERKLYELPALREAMNARRLSYEKARLIARHAEEDEIDQWIARAREIPCLDLRRELLGKQEAQMCARGEFEIWAPRHVAEMLLMTFRTVRKAVGRPLSPGQCYAAMAGHFSDTWTAALAQPNTVQRRVLERDGWSVTGTAPDKLRWEVVETATP